MNKETKKLASLLKWVEEYEIEQEIKDTLGDEGYEAAVKLVTEWFDGFGEADAIVTYFAI